MADREKQNDIGMNKNKSHREAIHSLNPRASIAKRYPFLKEAALVILLLAALFFLIFIGWKELTFFFRPPRIAQVWVVGDFQAVDKAAVQKQIAPYISANFFSVNLQKIQASLQGLPKVATVEVRRIWPNALWIRIEDEQIVARWGSQGLVNNYGEAITVNDYADIQKLPIFIGPPGKGVKMLDYYQQMQSMLASITLSMTVLQVDENDNWDITLNDGIILHLGDEDVLTRMQRFVKVYPKLFEGREGQVKSVDLRYHSGMAVAWKK
ncbi:MAG: hypothetical protein A2X77_03690 [Gammaproteobacteria bacterium GWE2_42_36]|nr:MAG: hypothetical protein A2X77_03690 [Gammaproteobacteria bacterium GWE2_42_36]HCU04909.1 hypothetical protein [Coxiellaceae bacterium]